MDGSSTDGDEPLQPRDPPREVLINIACDKLASETMSTVEATGGPPLPLLLDPPYTGSRAMLMLKIGNMWITFRYKEHLYEARRTKFF